MKIQRVVTGVLEENCYILSIENECLVIDPGDDYEKIERAIDSKKVLGVLITHLHNDHIGALKHFLKKKSVKILKKGNLEEKEYQLSNFKFNVLFNPGHSKDSVTYYFTNEKVMFVGDFVFKNSIGRCDLPGGSEEEMKKSLEKLKTFDDSIVLYPGHYDSTTIGDEKKNNIYFK